MVLLVLIFPTATFSQPYSPQFPPQTQQQIKRLRTHIADLKFVRNKLLFRLKSNDSRVKKDESRLRQAVKKVETRLGQAERELAQIIKKHPKHPRFDERSRYYYI
jgi:septal ring factor EnvC (AmiA/AmiB activator)